MATSKTITIVLLIALIGTNAFWFFRSIDTGISYSYLHDSSTECHEMLQVAIAIIPVIADLDSGKSDVIKAAEDSSGFDSFEKDGLVWIDGFGIGFNEMDRVEIATSGPVDSFWPQS